MSSNYIYGTYYNINSPIHKLNPIFKLISFIIILILSLITNSIPVNLLILLSTISITILSFIPIKYYIKPLSCSLIICILLSIILYLLNIKPNLLIIVFLKLILIIHYLSIILSTTTNNENIYAIEKVLSSFNILKLPISSLSFEIDKTLRYIPLYIETKENIFNSIKSRGINYKKSNLIHKIILRINISESIDNKLSIISKNISSNAKLRILNTYKPRTNYRKNKLSLYDIIFLLYNIILIVIYLLEVRIS